VKENVEFLMVGQKMKGLARKDADKECNGTAP